MGEEGCLRPGSYARNTLCAMASLGDADGSGRLGYLKCLGGLTKLRHLHGNAYAKTDETKPTLGWAEARWVASHCSELEMAEFFSESEEPTESFVWLRVEPKNGKLIYSINLF
ncbi:hypothetical protein BGX24_000466 [Mortierella sp. AD032]|nr:hypothetical protein BGX24_000466 [Mortierella sp. AD032]